MEEKMLFGALTVYRERGRYLRRLEQFDKAKASYDEALKAVPEGDDVRTLTGRSQVCADAVKPLEAYNDAELALTKEPRNMCARNMQALATYTMCEFERSTVINYRGYRQRKKPSYFREGVSLGVQTIEDCIGKNAGNVMVDFLPLIKQEEAARRGENEQSGSMHVSRIPKPESKKQMTQMEARQQLTLSRVMAMKYLEPMAYDKFFLQELSEDPRINSANSGGTQKLKQIIKEALSALSERQDMLRSARPYYSIKFAENSSSKHESKFKEAMLIQERKTNARMAERFLKQMEKYFRTNRVKDVIRQAEQMQLFLDTKTPRTLPDKDYYLDKLYRDVGEAYLIQNRLSYTLSERGNRRRVAFLMGLPLGRAQSFDSVMANYPYKFIDLKRATQKVMDTLDMCENATMRCWLNYELSRLLLKQKNFALSKFYAKRCQKQADEMGSVTWWLNGCFVLMSGDMQQGNSNEVRGHVDEAYEWVRQKGDSERLRSFLEKCAEMAAETVPADERKAIIQRQDRIVQVLPLEQKAETELLFKRISNVPVGRQFSVLPGKMHAEAPPERRRRRQRGLTVVPGLPKPLPKPPQSKVLGFQRFEM